MPANGFFGAGQEKIMLFRFLRWYWALLGWKLMLCEDDPGDGGTGGAGGKGNKGDGGKGGTGENGDGNNGSGRDEDPAVLESRLRAAFRERDAEKSRRRELEERINEIEAKQREREEAERQAAEEAEQQRLQEQGKFKEALEVKKAEFEKERAALVAQNQQIAMRSVMADLKVMVAKVPNIVPDAVGDVAVQLQQDIGLDENYEPFVKGPDGNPRRSPDNPLNNMTLDEMVNEFLKTRTYYLKTSLPAGGGAGAGEGEGGTGKWDPKRVTEPKYGEEWKKADPKGYAEAFDAHIKELMKKQSSATA
jgi:hypothetical protein